MREAFALLFNTASRSKSQPNPNVRLMSSSPNKKYAKVQQMGFTLDGNNCLRSLSASYVRNRKKEKSITTTEETSNGRWAGLNNVSSPAFLFQPIITSVCVPPTSGLAQDKLGFGFSFFVLLWVFGSIWVTYRILLPI